MSNLTTYEYDGHDRLLKTRFPVTAKGASASSTTDYEQLGYDANSNVTSRRLRDGNSIAFTFDRLNRATLKDLPGSEPDVTYAYDNLNRLTSASQTGNALSFTYGALSRNLTQVGPQGTVASEWDAAGRRTRLTYPGSGLYVDYDYLVTGDMTAIRENGATSGIGVLATFAYDDLGQRTSLTYGNGTSTAYTYDAVSRLTSLTNDLAGTGSDLTIGSMSYNPASQIISQVRSNDTYAWTGHGTGSTAGVANGLNQLTSVGGSATAHDSKGNLTTDPVSGKTYGYSSENLLTSASGGVTLNYDPSMRLYQLAGGSTTRLAYDGLDVIAEYNGSDVLQRRFVHGPGIDEPLVQYEGTGTSDRKFLHADERGSVIGISNASGAMLTINAYDEFGVPQGANAGRFQYTGQMWLPELGAYYYKARVYAPSLGRFLQTDPLGYGDSPNVYAYVLNDPANLVDPMGLSCWPSRLASCSKQIEFVGQQGGGSGSGSGNGEGGAGSGGTLTGGGPCDGVTRTNCPSVPLSDPRGPGLINDSGGYYNNGVWQWSYAGFSAEGLFSFTSGGGGFSVTRERPGNELFSEAGLTKYGPAFGQLRGFSRSRGILSYKSGGWNQALNDIGSLASMNGLPSPRNLTITSGPPVGWFMAPIQNGMRFFSPSGLQVRVVPGQARIDIPRGLRVGPFTTDISQFGETVHYGN